MRTDDVIGPRIEMAAAVEDLDTDGVLLDGIDIAVKRMDGNIPEKAAELRGPPERRGIEDSIQFRFGQINRDARHEVAKIQYYPLLKCSRLSGTLRPAAFVCSVGSRRTES